MGEKGGKAAVSDPLRRKKKKKKKKRGPSSPPTREGEKTLPPPRGTKTRKSLASRKKKRKRTLEKNRVRSDRRRCTIGPGEENCAAFLYKGKSRAKARRREKNS